MYIPSVFSLKADLLWIYPKHVIIPYEFTHECHCTRNYISLTCSWEYVGKYSFFDLGDCTISHWCFLLNYFSLTLLLNNLLLNLLLNNFSLNLLIEQFPIEFIVEQFLIEFIGTISHWIYCWIISHWIYWIEFLNYEFRKY